MSDRRRMKRRHLFYYLQVFERASELMLGYMMNVTPDGFMLLSDKPLEVGRTWALRLNLPVEIMGKRQMEVEGKSAWCRPDANPDFYNIGFQILHPSWDEMMVIEQLVDDFGMNEP
jgi:hypothetical protein